MWAVSWVNGRAQEAASPTFQLRAQDRSQLCGEPVPSVGPGEVSSPQGSLWVPRAREVRISWPGGRRHLHPSGPCFLPTGSKPETIPCGP